jgi:hypothetical protein
MLGTFVIYAETTFEGVFHYIDLHFVYFSVCNRICLFVCLFAWFVCLFACFPLPRSFPDYQQHGTANVGETEAEWTKRPLSDWNTIKVTLVKVS